ncbi:MAG TPA: DUF4250 domain-containing protein [Candidatus Choladousia intestinavium]|uniref:DUF4250 domain-containing protein n=1 Tax=Candidatus Choladousia intestinavium TaxID=2840727 RepID=A0A9D1D8E7_9FIRM|nr:DUF4250 domain-containing protein [Candidatus Choladousia intestinavium]
MPLPEDPIMLLSYVNTQLRDFYPTLDDFCSAADVSRDKIEKKLMNVGYVYNAKRNAFV